MKLLNYIKIADLCVGNFFLWFLTLLPQRSKYHKINNVLIIRPGGIGDAVLLLPTIDALHRRFIDAKIEVLCEMRNCDVLAWYPNVYRIWRYDRPTEFLRVFARKYDLVIDTEQWYRLSAVVARLTRSAQIIGFAGNGREQLLTTAINYDLTSYEADSFRALLVPLGVATEEVGLYPPAIPKSSITQAKDLLRINGLVNKRYVVLFPGASVPEKIWPIDRFIVLADFVRDLGFVPVVVGSDDDNIAGERIIAGKLGINLAGSTTLSEAVAVVANAAVFVSGDSGLLHIAASIGVPTVALFGPSDWRKWGPRGEHVRIVATDCPCSPCSKFGTIPRCSTKHCMALISSEQVTAAFADLILCVKNSKPHY